MLKQEEKLSTIGGQERRRTLLESRRYNHCHMGGSGKGDFGGIETIVRVRGAFCKNFQYKEDFLLSRESPVTFVNNYFAG